MRKPSISGNWMFQFHINSTDISVELPQFHVDRLSHSVDTAVQVDNAFGVYIEASITMK